MITKDELIAKQQLEIEELKEIIATYKKAFDDIRQHLYFPEQWSTKCPDFPKIAMTGIVRARQVLDDV